MRVVGIKQLKARLSEYLREVRRGEVYLVTDRNEVVAELRPARADLPLPRTPLESRIEGLIEQGDLTSARLPKEGWRWEPEGAGLPAGTASEVLERLREDRPVDA